MKIVTLADKAKMDRVNSNFLFCLFGLLLIVLTTSCATPVKSDVSLVTDDLLTHEDERMLWQKSEQEQLALESNGFVYPDQELETRRLLKSGGRQAQASICAAGFGDPGESHPKCLPECLCLSQWKDLYPYRVAGAHGKRRPAGGGSGA